MSSKIEDSYDKHLLNLQISELALLALFLLDEISRFIVFGKHYAKSVNFSLLFALCVNIVIVACECTVIDRTKFNNLFIWGLANIARFFVLMGFFY